jgi:hypothetical protein
MTFSESNNSYSLKVNPIISPEELNSGLWIVLAGIDDIPPHIALILAGKYLSVSAKKTDLATPIESLLKALSHRSVPTLFIKLSESFIQNEELGWAGFGLKTIPIFAEYRTLGNGEHSCLWPIRDFFAKTFSEKYLKASLVFELLAMAEKDGLIIECKSLFLESAVKGTVTLPKYTHEQIREKINSLRLLQK